MTIPGREDLRTYAAIGDGRTVALIAAPGFRCGEAALVIQKSG